MVYRWFTDPHTGIQAIQCPSQYATWFTSGLRSVRCAKRHERMERISLMSVRQFDLLGALLGAL